MENEELDIEPKTARGRWVKRVWGNLPALILIVLVLLIISLAVKIKGDAQRLEAEKLAEVRLKGQAVNVVVQELVPSTIRDRLSLPGIVEPWVRLELMAEVYGKVVEVSRKEGEQVQVGDVLLRIDSRDYENALDSARASYKLAAANLERAESLFRDELISRSDMESVAAEVVSLRAAMETARLQLERCTITAPLSGVINRLDAKVGLLLNISDPVAELLKIDRVKVAVGIPESDVNEVRALSHVKVTIDALGGRTVTGEKYFLASAPETVARLYRLELALDNKGEEILPGMFARAEVVKREVSDTLVIPLYAMITRSDNRFVYVEEGGKAVARVVTPGILDGWRVQIVDGLAPGERVIVVGHRSVEEGQAVNVSRTVTDPAELARQSL